MAIIINYGFEKDFIRGDTKTLNKFRPIEQSGEPMTLYILLLKINLKTQ